MKCRHCRAEITQPLVDLGCSPPSNAYLSAAALSRAETYFPLRVLVCTKCWLVQTQDFHRTEELFSPEYAYFSSVSTSWLRHAAEYCRMISSRLGLSGNSFVVEIAANDGYLLKNFVAAGIPCLGVEPTDGTALAAERQGIPMVRDFFGAEIALDLAARGKQADLIIGNNVYAHVPDINDFTAGMKNLLKPSGVITLEFPHVMRLIEHTQFDTIYHEHFSYLSLRAVQTIFSASGLRVFDVEELTTHGGSLRIYGCHDQAKQPNSPAVSKMLDEESRRGLFTEKTLTSFQRNAEKIKDDLLEWLIRTKRAGKTVAAYGAAAKGNTLLNFSGVKADLLPYVCDAATSKQGKFLPGTRIPVFPPALIRESRPDYVLILPWNIAEEVTAEHSYIKQWGGTFIVAVPDLHELA